MKLKEQNVGAQSGGTVIVSKGFHLSFRQLICTANRALLVRNAVGIAFQTGARNQFAPERNAALLYWGRNTQCL